MLKQVIKKVDKGVIGTVTESLKIKAFQSAKKFNSSDDLHTMNIPHWLARRNAAYHLLLEILSTLDNIETPVERREHYFKLMKLTELAIHSNKRYLFGLSKRSKHKSEDSFEAYLELIYNMEKSLCALMDASIIINAPKKQNKLINITTTIFATNATRTMDNVCIETEKVLLTQLKNLVDSFTPKLEKEKNSELKQLIKSEKVRYNDSMNIILEDLQHHDLITLRIKHR